MRLIALLISAALVAGCTQIAVIGADNRVEIRAASDDKTHKDKKASQSDKKE